MKSASPRNRRSCVRRGDRFGRWVVLADQVRGERTVPAQCACGVERRVSAYGMRCGRSRSCGCLSREVRGAAGALGGVVVRGERAPNAKLTEQQVHEIRRLIAAGASQYRVAREFGVSQPHVSRIASGRAWAHVR